MMDRKADWIGLCIKQALEEERAARSRARIVVYLLITVWATISILLYIRLNAPPVVFNSVEQPGFSIGGELGGPAR